MIQQQNWASDTENGCSNKSHTYSAYKRLSWSLSDHFLISLIYQTIEGYSKQSSVTLRFEGTGCNQEAEIKACGQPGLKARCICCVKFWTTPLVRTCLPVHPLGPIKLHLEPKSQACFWEHRCHCTPEPKPRMKHGDTGIC